MENIKKKIKNKDLYYWYHYDNRNNPDQNYDEDPEHFEKWKKEKEVLKRPSAQAEGGPASDQAGREPTSSIRAQA